MNPALLRRIEAGDFASVTLENEKNPPFTGYIASDPSRPGTLRMDGYLLSDSGHLQQVSISLREEDIVQVAFLSEPPQFIDQEGSSLTMEKRFFDPA